MANERGLAAPLGTEFAPPYRADRIQHLLCASRQWAPHDMAAIHMDTQLAAATPLLERVARLDGLGPEAEQLRARLLAWNRHMDADSTAAADFARLRSAVVQRVASAPELQDLAVPPLLYPVVFEPWLNLTAKVASALENVLATELLPGLDSAGVVRAALEETARLEPVTWGELHRLAPARILPATEGEEWPGLGGDHDCVLATSSTPGLTDLSSRGPSARYVWDLARRENSLWAVPLGARGIPGDPHGRDQLPLWLTGQLAPVITDFALLTEEPEHGSRGLGM